MLPTPFQPQFQPGGKVASTPCTNPLPTPVCSTPHTPYVLRPLLVRGCAQSGPSIRVWLAGDTPKEVVLEPRKW